MTPTQTANFAHPPRNVLSLGIEPGMRVADFGAGSGAYVKAIAATLMNAGHVYAIDVQQDLLRRIKNDATKSGFTNVDIIWADLEKPKASKIADNHLDLVLISNLLFQVEHEEPLLTEAMRILRPRGKLAIIDWAESFGGMGPVLRDVISKDKAQSLAESAGFEFVKEFDAGAHHYGLIFMRPGKNI